MSQSADQFDLLGYVKKAFHAIKDPSMAYPDFTGVVVNNGNVIPAHAKVLKKHGFTVNTIKGTGNVTGNLVVSICCEETGEDLVIYSSPDKIASLGESVLSEFEVHYVDDIDYQETLEFTETPVETPVETPAAKKSLFKRILGL